jgi:hypothetical protein
MNSATCHTIFQNVPYSVITCGRNACWAGQEAPNCRLEWMLEAECGTPNISAIYSADSVNEKINSVLGPYHDNFQFKKKLVARLA